MHASLRIVRYHSRFWKLMGQYLGIGWTLGRERVLDDVVNVGLFVPLGFLVHIGVAWRIPSLLG